MYVHVCRLRRQYGLAYIWITGRSGADFFFRFFWFFTWHTKHSSEKGAIPLPPPFKISEWVGVFLFFADWSFSLFRNVKKCVKKLFSYAEIGSKNIWPPDEGSENVWPQTGWLWNSQISLDTWLSLTWRQPMSQQILYHQKVYSCQW